MTAREPGSRTPPEGVHPDPEAVVSALGAADAETRRAGVAGLAALAAHDAVPLLLRALGDEDWRVRKEAARVASRHEEARGPLVPALVEALDTAGNVGLRNSSVETLVGIGMPAVEPLLARLGSMSEAGRKFALEALGDIGDRRGLPALLAATLDRDPNLRGAAIEALGRVGGSDAVSALRSIVERETDPFLRLAALESLNRAGAVLPAAFLLPLADDRILRRAAVTVLGRSVEPEAVSVLALVLRDHNRATAAAGAIALGELSRRAELRARVAEQAAALGPAELGLLGDLLSAGAAAERTAAVRLLDLCPLPDASLLLAEAAAEDDLAGMVDEALRARGPAAAQTLLEATRTVSPRALPVLLPIVAELVAAGTSLVQAATARLEELLASEDEPVAAAAAHGLGVLGAVHAVTRLVGCIERGAPRTARAAAQAMAVLGAREPAAVRAAVASFDFDGPGGDLVCGLFAVIGREEDVPRLRTALASASAPLRRAAAEALGHVGGEVAREAVIFALADESAQVQAAAARALGTMGGPRAIESLLSTLSSDDPVVVTAAARALVEIGDPSAVPALRTLIGASSGAVAMAALEALRGLGQPGDQEVLVESLGHPDEEVVKQALRSLAHGADVRAVLRMSICLDHPAWDVRRLAAELMGEIALAGARSPLELRLASEPDELVRTALVRALQRLS